MDDLRKSIVELMDKAAHNENHERRKPIKNKKDINHVNQSLLRGMNNLTNVLCDRYEINPKDLDYLIFETK